MERSGTSDTLTHGNDEIVTAIQNGGKERERALQRLYQSKVAYRSIAKIVREYGGYNPDIKEVFQEAIIQFDRIVRNGKFKQESSVSTFIIGIGKNICRNWNRTKQRIDEVSDDDIWPVIEKTYATDGDGGFDNEFYKVLGRILDQLKPICKTVLRLWQLNYSMKEIADQLNLGSTINARKRKYRCMKNLIAIIEQNPSTQNYLQEVWKTKI